MKRDTFSLRKTFLKPIAKLSDGQLGALFRAIYQYQCGETPQLSADVAVYFEFFKAEFEEEEAKRRRRAEKAAERRRKKLAEKEASEMGAETMSDNAVGSCEKVSSCSYKNVKLGSEDDLSVFDLKKVKLPFDRYEFDAIRTKFIEFRVYLSHEHDAIFLGGAHKLTLDEYATLCDLMTDQQLKDYNQKLYDMPGWNKEGRSYFHVIMKMHAIDTKSDVVKLCSGYW